MMKYIRNLYQKYQKLIKYIVCSAATALLETVVGWLLLNLTGLPIVVTNTVSILIGAVAHYFLTLTVVFEMHSNVQSALAYIATFVLGIVLQNLIIWVFYDHVLTEVADFWRYLLSKGFSLAIPFILTYYLRNAVNQAIKAKKEKNDEYDRRDASML